MYLGCFQLLGIINDGAEVYFADNFKNICPITYLIGIISFI